MIVAKWLKKLIKKKLKKGEAVCSAVVAAAGSSARMQGTNKLLAEIGGKPVLVHTLTALNKCREISEIIVVTREADLSTVADLCSAYNISKMTKIVIGGKTRLESVYNGVMQVSPKAKLIAVHDGARPFLTDEIVSDTVEAALKFNAAAPAVPVTSTIKLAEKGLVKKTIDREWLYEVQTPQVFIAELLKGALQNAVDKSLYITDDCMAVEAIGCRVKLTAGLRENIKLTTAADLEYAEAILNARRNKNENRSWL
ncbi:MAG: 2-C-methyl-D-erythritol 4-phosphate cytidylyltransferase [Clostridiales bacterium]|nr:2-C-methyl-D-erythritol 4-phosphate cytidylyltransferase [Clostridiales bacterium]